MIEEMTRWDWYVVAATIAFIHGAAFFWGKLRRRQIREAQERRRHEAPEEA